MFLEVLQVKLCQSRKVNLWVRMHGAQLSAGYTVNTHKMVARYTTYQLAKVIVPAESWPWSWPWAYPGCRLNWGPSCASLVAIRTLARGKSCLSHGVCRVSVCPCLSYKSLLLAGKWPDHHQTCIRWYPVKPASRVCSRSRSRSAFSWVLSLWLAGKSCSAPPFCACWQCTQQKAGPRAYAPMSFCKYPVHPEIWKLHPEQGQFMRL